ncbi:MAG: carboxypeptidase regulatory-like domain-containing protein, partial [Acidobacteriota bacterium]
MNKHTVRLAFLLALPLPSVLMAQTTAGFGAINGVVTDATGSVVPGAKVVIDNQARGIHREMETSGSGAFSGSTLVPADGYAVTISKAGFANYELRDIQLAVGQVIGLTPRLSVSSAATQVEVSTEAPVVENEKTDVSQVVSSRQILDLPVNGRRVDAFVLLTPGVTSDGAFGLISFRGNPGGNSFLTDGNDTTNQFYDENAGRTRTVNIAQDAVQEFQVVSSNFLAEYGKASGGVINTVTRSGSNNVNGTLYWFFRNRSLNATDITAQGINPPEWRHQAGASIGGPIVKNKLFYFFNGELQRRSEPIVSSNVLTGTSTSGPFDSSLNLRPGACAASAAQCAAAASYIVSRIKPQLIPRTSDINLLFGKIDYRPNDRNAISLSANYLDFRSPNGIQTQLSLSDGSAIGNNADTNVFDRTARAEWTFVATPTAVNSLRYGFFKDRQFDPASPSLLPSIGPVSLSITNTGSNVGYANGYPRLNPSEARHQVADTFSMVLGAHTLKFGADYSHVED